MTVGLAGAGLSLAGLGLARRFRRAVPTALFGGGAALCVLAGLSMYAVVTPDAPEPPAERTHYCQEHSGGPTTCPGG